MTPEDLENLQAIFQIGEHNPITLRAIKKQIPKSIVRNLHFTATDYPLIADRWRAFAVDALCLNAAGFNIYTCLNPIKPEFREGAVRDKDITCRRLLLIDLDRTGEPTAPATDDEIGLASGVADQIVAWFRERFEARPTRVMSGNGIHLLYPLDDLPNDEVTRDQCQRLLRVLATKFNTTTIKVDTSVHNASRITKVPGTIAYKGVQTEDRPFRKAVIL